jgi:hypothetical protein
MITSRPFFSNSPASLVIQNGACEPATALQPIVSFSKGADAAIEMLNCNSNEISIVKLAAIVLV